MPNVDHVRVLGQLYRPGTRIEDDTPPTWRFNPSSWEKRLPVVAAALGGCAIAIILSLFQLGILASVWEPFFGNGSRDVLTGRVSKMFPIPDAIPGAVGYLGDAVAGLIGGAARWRRMPWIVIIFTLFVTSFGFVSLVLFILQPTMYNSWCTLCLTSVAVSLAIIPFAWDEFAACWKWMRGRFDAGAGLWSVLMGR